MKIRNGFVSNSSSSSFVALVRDYNILDIKESDLKTYEYIAIGEYLYDGLDLIYINETYMLKLITLIKDKFEIYKVVNDFETTSTIRREDLDPGVAYKIYATTIDQNSSYNLEGLIRRYYPEIKDKSLEEQKTFIDQHYNKFCRDKKLERILK